MNYNTLIVLLGTGLLGASSGLIGTFAVLRGRSLTGDALAHAALPGLCLAFLVLGERSLPAMLAGALVTGTLGVGIIAALRNRTRIKEDAAIGIVLSVFYGAGVVLSSMIQKQSSGGSKAGLESYILGQTAGMTAQDVYLVGGVALVNLLLVLLLFKEFRLVAFDAEFATVGGWPAYLLDLILMALVAVTVVIGLPPVGVVMVTAMLILPAASARFWTERLGVMLALASVFGTTMGVAGTALSAQISFLPTGPVIVLAGTVLFLLSVLFAPRRGGVARLLNQWRFQRTLVEEALLRILFDLMEPALPMRQAVPLETIERRKAWKPGQVGRLLRSAEQAGWVESPAPGTYRLTEAGLGRAIPIVRRMRFWELFLCEHADLAGNVIQLDVESPETVLPEGIVEDVQARLRAAGRWPEGSMTAGKG